MGNPQHSSVVTTVSHHKPTLTDRLLTKLSTDGSQEVNLTDSNQGTTPGSTRFPDSKNRPKNKQFRNSVIMSHTNSNTTRIS